MGCVSEVAVFRSLSNILWGCGPHRFRDNMPLKAKSPKRSLPVSKGGRQVRACCYVTHDIARNAKRVGVDFFSRKEPRKAGLRRL